MTSKIFLGFLFVLTLKYGGAMPSCNSANALVEYGRLVLRVGVGSGINVLKAFTEGMDPKLVTGDADKYSDMGMEFTGGWTDKTFLTNWTKMFAEGYKKVRFTFWDWDNKTPVVDIIFNGKDSDICSWFSRKRIVQINAGPSVDVDRSYNKWDVKGEEDAGRHFYVNLNYGGCQVDFGYFMVSDMTDEVCSWAFNKGNAWKTFPQFIYSPRKDGILFKDELKFARTLTIAVF